MHVDHEILQSTQHCTEKTKVLACAISSAVPGIRRFCGSASAARDRLQSTLRQSGCLRDRAYSRTRPPSSRQKHRPISCCKFLTHGSAYTSIDFLMHNLPAQGNGDSWQVRACAKCALILSCRLPAYITKLAKQMTHAQALEFWAVSVVADPRPAAFMPHPLLRCWQGAGK